METTEVHKNIYHVSGIKQLKTYRSIDAQCSFNKAAPAGIERLQVAPLGAVVTNKVRFIQDHSFEPDTFQGNTGGTNKDPLFEEVPNVFARSTTKSAIIGELTELRVKFPTNEYSYRRQTRRTHLETFA